MTKKNGEHNKNETLLSYYTKNMTTHATIIVAVIFGLFSVLGIALNVGIIRRWLFLLPVYIILGVLGAYEISRYKYYSLKAKELIDELFDKQLKRKETEKTQLSWAFDHIHIVYFLFLLASFLGVYSLDLLSWLCSMIEYL